jgi:hypothetical protein
MNVEIGTETPIFLFWEYLLILVFCLCSVEGWVFLVGSPMKKCVHCVIHQVNDASVRIRQLYWCLRYCTALLYTDYRKDWRGEGREESGATPLTCCVG